MNEKKDAAITNDNVVQVLETTDDHEDVEFCNVDFGPIPLANHTFESCVFSSCRFRETPMTGAAFRTCVFRACELVVVKMSGVVFDRTLFESSKIMGINFSDADNLGFSPDFRKSVISDSVFGGLSFRKGAILECRLVDCDLSDCDFREAKFFATTFEHVAINSPIPSGQRPVVPPCSSRLGLPWPVGGAPPFSRIAPSCVSFGSCWASWPPEDAVPVTSALAMFGLTGRWSADFRAFSRSDWNARTCFRGVRLIIVMPTPCSSSPQ